MFENYPFDDILRSQQINDLQLGAVDGRNAVEYPIVLIVQPFDDHYELQLCFDESRLASAEAGQLLAHYQSLLQAAMENPEQSAAQLNWQTEADAAAIDLWNQTAQPLAPQATVVDAFKRCVENAPDSIALVEGEQHISFSRLDAWSDELAAGLQAAGLQVQDRIGVYQQADSAMIASVLAILKIGGVYVPLERDYPAARLQVMAEDAQLAAITCREEAPGEFCPTIPRVFVDSVNPDELQGLPYEVPALTAQHPAYIIYTSGTTGVPKGSITTHGGYLNTARYYTKTCEVNSGSRVLQFASICFDSFMFEFFHMLVGGASYILRPSAERIIGSNLARFITVNHITHVTLTSSVISTLINEPLPSIEWILSGGESCNANLVKAFADRFHFINAYGPSEASISVCSLEFSHPQEPISIGRPIDNTSLYILDELYNHVPVGGVGQIGIAGAGLAHGYQNNPRLTAEKFIPNPWSTDGQRLYLSGDLGFICCSDSLLHHVGRMDRQVKINGVRVELAEIESALRCIDVVKTCCVETTEVGQIIAFVCYEETNIQQRDNIKQQLRQHLPAHMVPAHIVVVEEMPLTENGKIDLAALNVLAAEYLENQRQNREFTSKIAVRIAELMEGILKTKNITANDDFFSMGGHSISAMEMVAKLNDTFSVNISLVDFYDIPNPEALAAKIKGESISSNSCPTVKKIEPRFKHRFEPFPLTEIQRAYWLGRYLGEQEKAVSTHGYFEVDVVDTEFDVNRFGEAFKHTINKHDMMRMCLTRNGEQQCQPEVNHFSIDLEDISHIDSDGKRAVIEKIRNMLSHQVFDAFSFPLFEVRVTKLECDRFRLHFSMDAMLMDFSSVGVFFSDLALAYETNAPLEKLGLTFRDYQIAFEGMKQEDAYSQAKGYWQARLDGLPGAPELPVIASKSADNLFVRRSVTIPAEHWETIQTLARQFRMTPTSLLLSAYVEVIALWSASDHFCINLSLFNRHELDPDIHKIVGDFTSMNLTECCVDRTKTYLERIKILQYQLWNDIDHRLYSGVDVLRDINRQNDSASRISMPVVFTSALGVDFGIGVEEVRGGEYHIPTYSITQTSQVWIDCQAYETKGSCIVNWDVMENIFEPGVLDAMFECFEAHLLQLSNDSIYNKRKVVDAPASQLAQRASLVEERLYPIEHLHKATLESARDYPQNIAFVAGEQTITYADVERYVRYLGMQLHKTGLTANEPVAVIFRKGWQQHVAALAVLFAGGCYVPIDADLPSQRIANYLEEANIKVAVISPGENVAQLPLKSHNIIIFDERETQGQEVLQQQIECEVAGPAYIIFTSGSTGTPKGVAVSHQAAINTIFDINRIFAVTKDDVVFSISAFNFDLSVYDLFGLMRVGGRIVVPTKWEQKDPESWNAYLKKEQVTIWNSVPALFNLLIDYLESIGAQLPVSLRLVMLSGDWIPKDLSQRAYKLNPNVKIISLGGATEAAIWSIYYPISQNVKFSRSIPYGKPLANQNIYVMKPDFTSCPTGVPGELMIAGEGLALGYWRDEEKTQHSFVHHPESGERLYQTGDYGRYLLDGNIEFLGRQDKQIKVSGHRVELGEIESVLDKHPLVKRSITILSADKQLIAYVQMYKPEDSTADFYDILRRHLESYLPDYMIPSYFVCLEGLPLTINGKVDYSALPEPERIKVSESSDSKYEDSILARIFADQLNLESVSPEDNFFQLGGDSLIAIQCVTKARSQGVSISIKDIFAQPTIGALEDFARGNENNNVNRSMIEPMVGAADSSTRNNALKEDGGTENPCIKGSNIENYPLFRGGQEDLYSSINIAQEHYALSPIEDIYPMTAIQQEMLLQSKAQPGRGNYIVQTTFEIQDKSFEFNIFYAAWQEIINRHAILRSQFIGADTRFPVQIVRQTVTAPVELNDWTNKQPDEQLFEYESYRYSDWVNGFDEGICGLSRVKVFKFNNDTYRILWTSHHCIGDGWAQAVITREMVEIYSSISEKSTYNLPTPVPFKRYVSWQAEQDVSLAKSYWKNLLQTEVISKPLLKTTLNSIGLPEQGKQFEVRRKLSVLKTANLRELAKSQQFTVNLIIQATWALILSRYSNQSKVIFGATASGRPETIEQVEQIVGPFLNSYPVIADLDINKSFIDLANMLKRQQMEKVKFEYVSLRQIASWVNTNQAKKLFSSLVIYNNYPKVDVQLGLKILHHVSQNNYPVTLVVYPSEQIEFVVKYNGFEYKEEQAELLLKHFLDMLDKVMQSPTEALSYFQLANTRNKGQKKLKLKELSL
ncbi:non-ribosomal peptide synthetase [Teredinibacter turnerae]|uniref:non-ribosomal peptide synthetase n=1 Tax=Teredinibacter turnerae TaxID=2426 RepID=UPI001F07D9DE|nr:non-ribosomal peptide synthetase [Teredinibacter turnerae]